MQSPVLIDLDEMKMFLQMTESVILALGIVFLGVIALWYYADKIRKDVKAIRALIAAGLQAESPEARRMAASIHNVADES